MEERRPDTSQDPPAAVSNQNAEVAEAGHDDGRGRKRRPEPRRDDSNPGGAGEESQATGHPENAG